MGLLNLFKKKPTIPHEALCMLVHRARHLEHMAAMLAEREEPEFPLFRAADSSGVLGGVLGLSTSNGVMPVLEQHLEGLQLDAEAAFVRAMRNCAEASQEVGRTDGYLIWEGPTAGTVAFIMSILRDALPIKGAPVLLVPREGLALVAGRDDDAALTAMIHRAKAEYAASKDFVSLIALTWEPGQERSELWTPPSDHPAHDAFVAAAKRTLLHEAQGEYHVHGQDAAPLAHLALMPEEKGGALHAAWMRDANVVIPAEASHVVLIDTDDEALPSVEVELATLLELLPHAFEALPDGSGDELEVDEARLVRTRGVLFPTLSEKRYLIARDALTSANLDLLEQKEVPGAELLAAWDAGDACAARYEGEGVLVLSPDGRYATVSPAEFGDRMSKRSETDQVRFVQGQAINALMQAMLRAAEGDETALANLPPPPHPPRPTRPALMSSNDLRAPGDEAESEEDELKALLVKQALTTSEPTRLFPIVRPPGFTEAQHANELGMVAGAKGEGVQVVHHERITRPAVAGLEYELVSDAGDKVMPLDGRMFVGELRETAWRTALLNVKAASLSPPHRRGDGWYEGPWHDDYDISRMLLLPSLARACKVKGEPLVFAPTLGRTWVAGSDDVAAMTAVLDAVDAHLAGPDAASPYSFRQLLFGRPWVPGETPSLWTPPAGHPLAARIAALDAALEKRRLTSMQNIGGFARGAYSPLQPNDAKA